ncbi:MAG: hypothetical protein AVDCRST_MAG33-1983 [uncultured Thermomicrobiales bacterium]|uniref:Uncharacterized protein n=1 Tax=uncultured Thermomicrobiales bacterium TaxID=1645740 RepID=A0A6J4UYX5_9BACT|nr:MAG: hypothetical protein AVDCRST_MAG33-1983 [uncultured Thermomicrobiales bacterium]
MDYPVSSPAKRGSFVVRSVAVAALLLSLVTGTVYAQSASLLGQDATPVAGDGGPVTAAAAPGDATAFVAINLDPESEQFQTSAALSGSSGLIELFDLVTGLDESDADDVSGFYEGLGATELGVVIPAVSTGQVESLSETSTDEVPEIAETDIRFVLATTDPEGAFDFLVERIPDLSGAAASDTTESDYNGVTIVSLPDTPSGDTMINLALVEDLIIATPTIEGIESSIDVAQGTGEAITGNARFQDVASQLDGDAMLFAYTDSTALFDDPATAELLDEMGIDLSTLGQFNVYGGLQVSADADAPGFRVNTVSFPNPESDATPAAAPDFSSDLTAQVPDSTMIYLGGNDLGQLLGPIVAVALASTLAVDVAEDLTVEPEVIAAEEAGTPGADADASEEATDEDAADVAPETDEDQTSEEDLAAISDVVVGFLTLLTGEYVVAVEAPEITSLSDPNSLFVLVASGIEGGPLVDSLLELASDTLAGDDTDLTVTSEVVDGATLYTATSGEGAAAIRFTYGIVDDQLLIGLGDSVQTFLDGTDASLADDPQFQETFAALGVAPDEGAVVYLDLATLLPLVQAGSELLAGTDGGPDADPACEEYDSQADAQAAYDEDPFEQSSLDQDFDGEACEDAFGTPATPEPMLTDIDFSGVVAYGQVTYQGDGFTASEGLFLVESAD